MVLRLTRRLGIAVTACVAALTAATSATAAPAPIDTYAAITGAPSSVTPGATLSFTLTVSQQSKYRLHLIQLPFQIWNTCMCAPDDATGTTASFLDPTTHTWHTTLPAEANTYPVEFYPDQPLLSPGQQLQVPVRVSLKGFRSGTYKLSPTGAGVGNALDANGNQVQYDVRSHVGSDRQFRIGTGSTTKAPVASSRPRSAASPKAAPPTTPAAATSSPSASPMPTPAPTEDSPSPAPIAPVADTRSAPDAFAWWWLIALPLLGAAGLILSRRRRPTPGTSQPRPTT
ncbi:hypothetical protein [Catellatospora tritici]|uniref:hypothetical protein n=1 Tax=Catellatospora tritici TaxID=2851566 RepID=UPI001C2D7AEA|nr:hypothetical protein [Catellatospora tritici]MBV1855083.1 hypothetical protein [Catellatospora tritici]